MPCNPNDNTINPVPFPPVPGGFGIPIAPVQVPFPGLDIPTGILQDLADLANKLNLLFPSSTYKPTVDNFTKGIFDFIANLLTQIAPFLSLYNFFMALLNIISCIIEVLCAIPNPFKIASKLSKLFSDCLPPFLNLFPWMALIAMIIALLLLILALIEYLIQTILAIIDEIIRNLTILGKGVTFQDTESTLAAIQKISELLCLIQNILAILVAVSAIFNIIESLAKLAGSKICDDTDTSGCCSPSQCPQFIIDSPLTGTLGELVYHNQIGVDLSTALGLDPALAGLFKIPPTRSESWQFLDLNPSSTHQFKEIITPIEDTSQFPPVLATFWPEGVSFDASTPSGKFPYLVDLRVFVDPKDFVPTDIKGPRYMRINDCGVAVRPYLGVYKFDGSLDKSITSGTLSLQGGLVTEDDGTPYTINGTQATLNTLIHKNSVSQITAQTVDDAVVFKNVEYTFRPVHGVLMSYSLITAGCMPQVRAEKNILNSILVSEDIRAVIDKLPKLANGNVLPDIAGAQKCVSDALANFRTDVSVANAAVFQSTIVGCLNDLKNQTLATVSGAIATGTSQFKSEVTVTPDLQFTTSEIIANVVLKDPGGTNIATNIPADVQSTIESKLKGEVTLGEITDFTYDGTSSFNATITSRRPGEGKLTVLFDGKVFSTVVPPAGAETSKIIENEIGYTFIEAPTQAAVRRDATDVAGSES